MFRGKKVAVFGLFFIALFALAGCSETPIEITGENVNVVFEDTFDLAGFELENVVFSVINQNGERVDVQLDGTMISDVDAMKLLNPGSHQIRVTYDEVTVDIVIHLKESIAEYRVTFVGFRETVIEQQTVREGEAAVLPVVPEVEGYMFDGWDKTVSLITENSIVRAIYVPKTYTVTLIGGAGEAIDTIVDIPYNTRVALPEPERHGYTFKGWFLDEMVQSIPFYSHTRITEDITLYAQWAVAQYTVRVFDGEGVLINQQTVIHGDTYIPNVTPSKEGYTFTGWDMVSDAVTEDTNIYPMFEPKVYVLVFNTMGGDDVEDVMVPFKSSLGTLPVPVKEGYTFIGWYEDSQFDVMFDANTMPYQGATLYARYVADMYQVSFDGGEAIDSFSVAADDVIYHLPVLQSDTVVFGGWMYEDTLIETPFKYTFGEDITLIPVWHALTEGVLYEVIDGYVMITGYEGHATDVYIPNMIDGYPVEVIGFEAFRNDQTIAFIHLSRYLVEIEAYAFENMQNLHTIILPESLEVIGKGAFEGIEDLTVFTEFEVLKDGFSTEWLSDSATLYLGYIDILEDDDYRYGVMIGQRLAILGFTEDSVAEVIAPPAYFNDIPVRKIANRAFLEFEINHPVNIVAIHIPYTITHIGENAFESHYFVKSLTFAENSMLEVIGFGAFASLLRNESVVIPASVRVIGELAFFQNNVLDNLVFQAGSQLETIERMAFKDNIRLTHVVLPEGLQTIGEFAFNQTTLEHLVLPDTVTFIGESAFNTLDSLESVILSNTVDVVESLAFDGTNGLKIFIDGAEKTSEWLSQFTALNAVIYYGIDGAKQYGETEIFYYIVRDDETIIVVGEQTANSVVDVFIPSRIDGMKVTEIHRAAFQGSQLNTVEIGAYVERIGEYAFAQALDLRVVGFAANSQLKTIDAFAFQDTQNLVEIFLPETVENIQTRAFEGSENLSFIYLPASLMYVGSNAFIDTPMTIYLNASLDISSWHLDWNAASNPTDTTYEAFGVFRGVTYYQVDGAITIKGTPIDSRLENLIIPDQINGVAVTAIAESAFEEHQALEVVYIGKNVVVIGASAFYMAGNIEAITFAVDSKLETIQSSAFSHMASLATIDLPASLLTIENDAFANSGLAVVHFAEDSALKDIGTQAFINNALTVVSLPQGVENIEDGAFAGNPVDAVYLPEAIVYIGMNVFSPGNNQAYTIYAGDASQPETWNNSFASGSYTIIWGTTLKGLLADTALIYGILEDDTLGVLGRKLSSNQSEVVVAEMLNGYIVRSILEEAFYEDDTIVILTVPDSVLAIDRAAFRLATALETVVFSETSELQVIGFDAFRESSIASITIPSAVHTIEESAFREALHLSTVIFGEDSQLTEIAFESFRGATSLVSIEIPKSVTRIGQLAFNRATGLESVTFEAGSQLTHIDRYAFNFATSLKTVLLPEGLLIIGDSAFYANMALTDIHIPSSVTTIRQNAFSGSIFSSDPTNNLKTVTFGEDSQLTSIGSFAFHDNIKLETIVIPASVETIGTHAFSSTGLTSVIFEKDSNLQTIGNFAFTRTKLTTITIPQSVLSLGTGVFSSSALLEEVIIQRSVSEGITELLPATVVWDAFTDTHPALRILVPDDSIEAYKNADVWEAVSDYIYGISTYGN